MSDRGDDSAGDGPQPPGHRRDTPRSDGSNEGPAHHDGHEQSRQHAQSATSSSRLGVLGDWIAGDSVSTAAVFRGLVLLTLAIGLTLAPYAVITGGATLDEVPPERRGTLPEPSCVGSDAQTTTGEPTLDVTVSRGESQRTIRVDFDTTALRNSLDTERFRVATTGTDVRVRDATGFRRDDSQYRWRGTSNASLTYTFEESNTTSTVLDGGAQFSAGDNWTLAPLPAVSYASVNYTIRPDGVTPASGFRTSVVYVGNLSTVDTQIGCQNVTVHYPPNVNRSTAAAVADSYNVTSHEFPLGTRYEAVSTLVTPWDMGVGGYTIGNFVTVNPRGNVGVETIAVHEYIHTRQRNRYAPEMRWLTEAIPSYYMFNLRYRAGETSRTEYALQLHGFDDQAQWNQPFETETTPNHYFRGAVTLAALDWEIRAATNGTHSLLDVVARMNDMEGPITRSQFEMALSSVAGESLDGWVTRHVVDGEPVPVAAPDGGVLPQEAWLVLSIYEVLLGQFPPFAFVFVVIWYALFGSVYEMVARLWR